MSDIIRFLIASDIHAGYGESKKHIHNDSFVTFEEVLKNGSENNVDFVLLGGDLFHENNPTRETQLRVTRLLRRYCMHNNELKIEFVSDPTVNFQHSNFPTVNYEDENLNIGMPVFTIHGNHDDLSGKGLTALDVFHESGLINLFGKFNDVDQIEVSPILLKKGKTKIAIYGISSQRDDRLARAFMNENVKFLRPDVEPDSWFSILVLHQNRPRRSSARTTGAYLPIAYIPPFFDIVIWGHEHRSITEAEYVTVNENYEGHNGFYIIQPGSTVATSLCCDEAVQKHCFLMTVHDQKFKYKAIKLQTTRQIILDEIILDDSVIKNKLFQTTVRQKNMQDEQIIVQKIEELLEKAIEERGLHQPTPPLFRIKVIYSGQWLNIPPINGRRFGSRYIDRVANANEMFSIKIIRPEKSTEKTNSIDLTLKKAIDEIYSVDQIVEKYFSECSFNDKMSILTEVALSRSIKEYSNVDATFTYADRFLSDSIKTQINVYADRLQNATETTLNLENINSNTLTKHIEQVINEFKKEQNFTNIDMSTYYSDNTDSSFTKINKSIEQDSNINFEQLNSDDNEMVENIDEYGFSSKLSPINNQQTSSNQKVNKKKINAFFSKKKQNLKLNEKAEAAITAVKNNLHEVMFSDDEDVF